METSRRTVIPEQFDVVSIRKSIGMGQAKFADLIGVSAWTLGSWERGDRCPGGPARVLLALLERNPKIVQDTLNA